MGTPSKRTPIMGVFLFKKKASTGVEALCKRIMSEFVNESRICAFSQTMTFMPGTKEHSEKRQNKHRFRPEYAERLPPKQNPELPLAQLASKHLPVLGYIRPSLSFAAWPGLKPDLSQIGNPANDSPKHTKPLMNFELEESPTT